MADASQPQKDIILTHLHTLLQKRDYPKTICPSEVARALSGHELNELGVLSWRDAMDPIREVVWELRENGEVEVMQKGEVVGVERLEDIRGPIRVRSRRD